MNYFRYEIKTLFAEFLHEKSNFLVLFSFMFLDVVHYENYCSEQYGVVLGEKFHNILVLEPGCSIRKTLVASSKREEVVTSAENSRRMRNELQLQILSIKSQL